MIKRVVVILLSIGGIFSVAACMSSAVHERLEKRVAEESAVNNTPDLRRETSMLIENMHNLNDEQRRELLALRDRTRAQVDKSTQRSLRLRAILMKDLMTNKRYDEDEVYLIKEEIAKAENKKLAVIFDGIREANFILDRQTMEDQMIYQGFFQDERMGYQQQQ